MIYLRILYPGSEISHPAITFASICLAVIGVAFIGLGIRALAQAGTTANPLAPEKASHLTTRGIYAWSRNPVYLGLLALLMALGVHLQSPVTLVGALVFVLYMTRFQIKPEERALAQLFGKDYQTYQSRTRRWI